MYKAITKHSIIVYSILIVPIMIVCFSFCSRYFSKTLGYFIPYGIYLVMLLVGTISFGNDKKKLIMHQEGKSIYYYIAAFIPVVATFFVAFLPTMPYMTVSLVLITLIYALVNGALEELFWRYTFNKIYRDHIWLAYIIPTLIFSCWHIALLFAKQISFNGGAITLVGGAAMMGMIWGFVMYQTKNIKVVIVAHVMTNFFAFSQLIYTNGLVA